MGNTLNAETARPARSTLDAQQVAFDAWVHDFNHERPHEALGMAAPSAVFSSSSRPYPSRLVDPEYPDHFDLRRVRPNGCVVLRGSEVHFGSILKGETLGFEPLDDGFSQVWLGPIYLGLLTSHGKGKVTLDRNHPVPKAK